MQTRELDAEEANAALEHLVNNLAYDVEEAVQELRLHRSRQLRVSRVLPCGARLRVRLVASRADTQGLHPRPDRGAVGERVQVHKGQGRNRRRGTTAEDQKERYARAVAQVALRTLHEVFEADRAGRIQTISLTVVTSAIDAATGRLTEPPLLAVATDRSTFEGLDLSNVVPSATLSHLKATVSKNPFGLVAIDVSKGVRG